MRHKYPGRCYRLLAHRRWQREIIKRRGSRSNPRRCGTHPPPARPRSTPPGGPSSQRSSGAKPPPRAPPPRPCVVATAKPEIHTVSNMTSNPTTMIPNTSTKRGANVSSLGRRWKRKPKKNTQTPTPGESQEKTGPQSAEASKEPGERSTKTYQAAAASFEVLPNFSDASLALAISVWMLSWMLLIRTVARATGAVTTAVPANDERVHTADGARRADDTAATPVTKPIILDERGEGWNETKRDRRRG